jgi:hypothetical protein
MDAVVRLPAIGKRHQLDHSVSIDQMTMIIGAH